MQTESQAASSKRRKAIGKAIIVFLAVMLLLTFFSNTINNFSLPRVVCENPTNGSLVKEVTGSGTVQAKNVADLYTQANMKVTGVMVKAGDKVKKGQTLMTLDTTDVADQIKDENDRYRQMKINLQKLSDTASKDSLAASEKAVATAEGNLDKAKKNYQDVSKLYEDGLETADSLTAAKQSITDAQKDYESAKTDYENAKADKQTTLKNNQRDIQNAQIDILIEERKIARMNEQLNLGKIIAPVDGIITELNFTEGSVTNDSKPIYKIADTSKGFEFLAVIDADSSEYFSLGDSATITFSSLGGKTADGKITEITDDRQQRGAMKDVTVDIPSVGLEGGETGSFNLKKDTKSYPVLVPNSAIGHDNNGDFVYVLRERKGPLGNEHYIQKASVTVEDSDDLRSAVTNGINMFDQVVTSADKPLSDGMRVMLSQ